MDGRLDADCMAQLERHLATCGDCQHEREALTVLSASLSEQELTPEPAHLSQQIMARVSAYEEQRVARRAHLAVQARDTALRLGVILALVVLVVEIIQPSLWTALIAGANRGAPQVMQALTAPGPNSVAWSIWALGAIAALVVATRIIRSEAYASWVRAVSERLPQLW